MYMTDISDSFLDCFRNMLNKTTQCEPFNPTRVRPHAQLEIKHCGLKNCFEIISDRNLISLGESSGCISVYSLGNFKKLGSAKNFSTEISALRYVPERDLLFASAKNKIKAFRIRKDGSMKVMKSIELKANLGFMYPINDLQALVTSEGIRSTSIRDLTTFKLKGEIKKSGHSVFPIKKYGYMVIDYFDGLIGLCDVRRAREISRVETGHRFSNVMAWGFCERENLLIAALSSGKMKLWNLSGEGLVYVSERSIPRISSLDAVNGGRMILFAREDNAIWGYDLEEKETLGVTHIDGNVKEFRIYPKRKLLFTEQHHNKIDVYSYSN